MFVLVSVEGAEFREKEDALSVVKQGVSMTMDRSVDHESTSTIELVGRIVVYLLLLAAIGAVILHFFRQGKFIKGLRRKGSALKVLETHMLGNKQFLVVVEYEENKVLLGVGPGMINKLCFLDDRKGEASKSKKMIGS